MSSISYIKEGKMKTYGTLGGDFREWEFNENEVLLGLYGSTDGRKITKLGFITLNTYATDSCVEAIPIVVEEDKART